MVTHARADLAELFDRYYQEALAAGHSPDDYRNDAPFGNVVKASQKNYTGNRPRPARRSWVQRLWASALGS